MDVTCVCFPQSNTISVSTYNENLYEYLFHLFYGDSRILVEWNGLLGWLTTISKIYSGVGNSYLWLCDALID